MLRGGLAQEVCGWIVGWIGQSGVLAPWALRCGHELDIKLFIYLEYLDRLAQFSLKASLNAGLYE